LLFEPAPFCAVAEASMVAALDATTPVGVERDNEDSELLVEFRFTRAFDLHFPVFSVSAVDLLVSWVDLLVSFCRGALWQVAKDCRFTGEAVLLEPLLGEPQASTLLVGLWSTKPWTLEVSPSLSAILWPVLALPKRTALGASLRRSAPSLPGSASKSWLSKRSPREWEGELASEPSSQFRLNCCSVVPAVSNRNLWPNI
jgi:hypothetical protein